MSVKPPPVDPQAGQKRPRSQLANTIASITIAPSPRVDPATLCISESEVRAVLPPKKKLRAPHIAKRITSTLQTSLKQHEDNRQLQKDKLMLGITEGATVGSESSFSLFQASNYDPANPVARPRIVSSSFAAGGGKQGGSKTHNGTGRTSRGGSFSGGIPPRHNRSRGSSPPLPSGAASNSSSDSSSASASVSAFSSAINGPSSSSFSSSPPPLHSSPEWFIQPGSHCARTQTLLDANSRMIMRLTQALAADGGPRPAGGEDPTPEEIEATRAVVSQVRENIDKLVSAVGSAMLTRRDCQRPGEPEMSEDERIIVTLGYATQARGKDMRLRVALLQASEDLCLASSISQRKRELYDVLMCLLQRDIETQAVHDTIVSILTDLISDLQRDTFSVQTYMKHASKLPIRPHGLTAEQVKAARLQYMKENGIIEPPPQPKAVLPIAQSPIMPLMPIMGGAFGMIQPMMFEETTNPLHIHIRMASTTMLQLKHHIDSDAQIRQQQQIQILANGGKPLIMY